MIKKITLSGLFLFSVFCFSQVKVGEWKDHLSYNTCNSVTKMGNVVYASNGTGIIKYNTEDGSIERLNKINGLSDIGIRLLRRNPYNNTILIIYENANIDVIKNGSITNVSDIQRKTITGKKTINEVTFKNNLAYLACGFGIVVFDTDKLEVKDTYLIGAGGTYINVYQVAYTDSTFFAATSSGLLKANYLSGILNNFQSWKAIPTSSIPAGTYNGVVRYGNNIVANYSPWAATNVGNKDTLYQYNGISWSKSVFKDFPYNIKKMYPSDNTNFLNMHDNFGYETYGPAALRIDYITAYTFGPAFISDAYADYSNTSNPSYWIGDLYRGLIDCQGAFEPMSKVSINGTNSNFVSNVSVSNGNVVSAPTTVEETGSLKYSQEGLNFYDGSQWIYIKDTWIEPIFDMNFALMDKKDPNHIYASSWKNGLVEYQNGKLVNVFDNKNSAIPQFATFNDWFRVAGLAYDKSGNLWIGSSDVSNFLTVRKTNGTFQNFEFASGTPHVGRLLTDKNNQVWVLFPRGSGIAVFKNNNFASPGASNFKMLTTDSTKGKLPSLYVHAAAEDLDGHIWVGTVKGLAVFYSPANITGGGNYDCQQIKIEQDGHVQILLETEKVTAIAVDGANRKWVGTESSGIFCFSPDGQKQIYHFTKDDSPLFSNTLIDLAYDDVTGDIFIATDQGLQSYRSDVIKGQEEYDNVHAFPNPVRPGYGGSVYIKGLVDESVVKITDVAGNLVWEAKSQGGQIAWGLSNLSGQRVVSGVYLAYCATSDGAKKAVTKILVMN